jgi:hypothetical protein
LLFGTDSSFFPRGWNHEVRDRQRAALDSLGVGATVEAMVMGENFERLFG